MLIGDASLNSLVDHIQKKICVILSSNPLDAEDVKSNLLSQHFLLACQKEVIMSSWDKIVRVLF